MLSAWPAISLDMPATTAVGGKCPYFNGIALDYAI